jgi:hypothetical protein
MNCEYDVVVSTIAMPLRSSVRCDRGGLRSSLTYTLSVTYPKIVSSCQRVLPFVVVFSKCKLESFNSSRSRSVLLRFVQIAQ